jgi:hypothetical protein
VQRKIFGPNRDEVTALEEAAQWALHDLYSNYWLGNKSRRIRWMWHVWGRHAYRILVRKPAGKRPLERPRHG